MSLLNYRRSVRTDNVKRIGYKVFKRSKVKPGTYRGVFYTFAGGYVPYTTYRETNSGLVPDGKYDYGFHIFLSKSDANAYRNHNEAVVQVEYSGVTGFGTEYGRPVVVAKEIKLLGEV